MVPTKGLLLPARALTMPVQKATSSSMDSTLLRKSWLKAASTQLSVTASAKEHIAAEGLPVCRTALHFLASA